ncbi:hypothetical protein ABFS83_13G127500 [Erythranthe nasuta]|nr:PREDICTED: non-specific lipid-transfer protein-like isoform X1 [Erythranthe guttata]|eukprot:XP_012848659.1 PREDICTED: non-specific lipid-transfer protein-like isoform X1 [Erythranthe guttata]
MGGCFKWFAAVALVVLVVGGDWAAAEIQCNDAVARVLPCEAFLLSGDSTPSAACCSAVQSLDQTATASAGDRRAICECFKDVAKSFPINLAKAQLLPELCHVTVGVKIDPDVDCTRI